MGDIFASDSESDGQEEDCQLKPLKISFGSENDTLSKSNVSLTLPKEKPTQNSDVKDIEMKSKLNRSVQCSILESDSENDSFTTQNLEITSKKNDVKVKSNTNTSVQCSIAESESENETLEKSNILI